MKSHLASLIIVLLALPSTTAFAVDRCEQASKPVYIAPNGWPDPDCTAESSSAVVNLVRTFRDGDLLESDNRLIEFTEDKLQDELDGRLTDGLSTGFDTDVGSFGSIGFDLGTGVVLPEKQTKYQKQTRDRLGVVWLKHQSGVKAGASYGKRIPLGNSGVFIRTGISAGAQAKLTFEVPYSTLDPNVEATPDLAKKWMKQQLRSGMVWHLPYDADEWTQCVPGERSISEAPRHVRLFYGAGYGWSEDLGDLARAGASVGLTRSRTVSGNLVQIVECVKPGVVNVELRRSKNNVKDITFDAFAGINILEDAVVDELDLPSGLGVIDELAGSAVDAVSDPIEDALSARYTLRTYEAKPREMLARGTFDFSRAGGRVAFQEAMRGDFQAAYDLSHCGEAGVDFNTRYSDFDVEGLNRRLKLSIHEIHSNFSVRDGSIVFKSVRGKRTDHVSGLNIDRARSLGSEGNLGFEVVIRDNEDGSRTAHASANAKRHENFTTEGDFEDLLAGALALTADDEQAHADLVSLFSDTPDGQPGSWPTVGSIVAAGICVGLTAGYCAPLALVGIPFNSDWGETEAIMKLTLNEKGLINITHASEDEIYGALAATTPQVKWAQPGMLERFKRASSLCTKKAFTNSNTGVDDEWDCDGRVSSDILWELEEFQAIEERVDRVLNLRNISDPIERAREGRDILEDFREPHLLFLGRAYNPAGLVAMALLAGEEGREIEVSLSADGGDIQYSWVQD